MKTTGTGGVSYLNVLPECSATCSAKCSADRCRGLQTALEIVVLGAAQEL